MSANFRIYIRNLNEKVKLDELKSKLKGIFSSHGNVIDVVAHKNIRLRGQAFVVFDNTESATKALEAHKDEELFGKPMVIQFAKSRSDATVKRVNPEEFEEHKQKRLKIKEERNKEEESKLQHAHPKAKKPTKEATGQASTLPPNRILFLENLPPGCTAERLDEIFSAFPGFVEVRLVAVRRLGFVEFTTDEEAAASRQATLGLTLDDHVVKITFAKR
uniref:ARAD1C43428p n=1 Tax=Blastobotrys adeninivorans TaxID=409370 RepID=A0A060TA81_BLAAD